VSVLAFFASVLALALVSGFRPASAALLAGLLGLVFEPFASELRVGNVNAVQLGMITAVVALFAKQRLLAGGAVLGAATVFKPTVAVVVVVVAVALATGRSWRWLARFAAGSALGACAAVAAAWMYFESLAPWGDWLAILPEVAASRRTLEAGNYSPAALLGGGSALLAVVLLGATSVALARSRARPEVRLRVAVACGLGIMLLSSRLVWIHYYVLAVPAIVLALRAEATAWLAAAALLLFTRVPSSAGPLASALAMNAATALLLVALGVQLLRASAETPAGPDPA
jgi:hypothetical protein